ncbi:hypothetical protein FGO68_gene1429 [Halteria grandinella]|uniref:Uncharacterized protein n=1 Tax=Halteria grandinella TaxID=5974 RepID=A0A8J8NBY7_HALGN|nr:hypothetical protein FGO68_gene1429 [Halteria grandinella]
MRDAHNNLQSEEPFLRFVIGRVCDVYSCLQSSGKDQNCEEVSCPKEYVIQPPIIHRDHIIRLTSHKQVIHPQHCLNYEKQKVEWHHQKDGEFAFHQFAKQSELEEEGLPDEEEEPKDEAKVHYHLQSKHCVGDVELEGEVGVIECTVLDAEGLL